MLLVEILGSVLGGGWDHQYQLCTGNVGDW